jgi:hypothetical protein
VSLARHKKSIAHALALIVAAASIACMLATISQAAVPSDAPTPTPTPTASPTPLSVEPSPRSSVSPWPVGRFRAMLEALRSAHSPRGPKPTKTPKPKKTKLPKNRPKHPNRHKGLRSRRLRVPHSLWAAQDTKPEEPLGIACKDAGGDHGG